MKRNRRLLLALLCSMSLAAGTLHAQTTLYSEEVEAAHDTRDFTLAVSPDPGNNVVVSPAKETYAWRESVSLTANPGAYRTFTAWGGDLSGSLSPATLLMEGSKDKTVTAAFAFSLPELVFADDFENDLSGTFPALWRNGPWPNQDVIVVEDSPAAYLSGTQSLRVASLPNNAKGLLAPQSGRAGDSTLDFALYMPAGTAQSYYSGFARGHTNAGGAACGIDFFHNSDGTFRIQSHSSVSHTPVIIDGLPQATWVSVRIELDWDNRQMHFFANGTQSTAFPIDPDYLPDANDGWTADWSFAAANQPQNNLFYIDDVQAYHWPVEVTPATSNQPPIANAGSDLAVTDTDGDGSETVTLDGSASIDSDGTIVSWLWSWTSGTTNGETTSGNFPVGSTTVTLTVTDNDGATATDTVDVVVGTPNRPPVLSAIATQMARAGEQLSFTAVASDPDVPAQDLIYSIINAPLGAVIEPMTGVFTWTPTEDQAINSYMILLQVTDGELTDLQKVDVFMGGDDQEMVLFAENFDDNELDSAVTVTTIGTFSANPGIKDNTSLGSLSFGFGRSTVGGGALDGYQTHFTIDLGDEKFISRITFREREEGDWGSYGEILLDGEYVHPLATPTNTISSRGPIEQSIAIEQFASSITLLIKDITNASELFFDDIVIYGQSAESDVLQQVAELPVHLQQSAFSASGDRLYVLGGTENRNFSVGSQAIYQIDLESFTLSQVSAQLPYGMLWGLSAATGGNGKIYLGPAGGPNGNNGFGTRSRIVEFDPVALVAGEMSVGYPISTWGITAASDDQGSVYFFGGHTGGDINSIYRLNPDTGVFESAGSMPWSTEFLYAVSDGNGEIFLINIEQLKFAIYDPFDNSVSILADIPSGYIFASYLNMAWIDAAGDCFFVLRNAATDDMEIFRFDRSETTITNTGILAPPHLLGGAVAKSGSDVYLLGGDAGDRNVSYLYRVVQRNGANNQLPATYNLSLSAAPTAGGVATADRTGPYESGSSVTLTATANPGYTFTGWSGDASGQTNPLTLTMDSDKIVTANFELIPVTYNLSLSAAPTAGGSATADRTGPYESGSSVTLTASANPGYSFTGWSGDASGQTNPLTLTMDSDKIVTANFELLPVPPTIVSQPQGGEVYEGESFSFFVAATGDGPFSYQWYRDGVEIPGATAESYTLGVVRPENAANYTVVVSGSGGETPSASAALSVTIVATGSRALWPDSTSVGGGWFLANPDGKFSYYWDAGNTWPWIYHAQHGWLWVHGVSPDSIWFYDSHPQVGWFFSNQALYPYLYILNWDGPVYLHEEGATPDLRWFYSYHLEEWVPVEASR